ncbi:hypothetical protein PISMIDRAFT_689736 [Pisolithus microcarpus 441]|uniref:Uncharacterized protein n=1 Tax=Pisolithus microcarpus 441 TaxID=765257 RepID=A0A0C9Y526_9AGAM|nr:hypothetical protein PISMIDRAFT_689736 [Pisolithus microcarpus 441]
MTLRRIAPRSLYMILHVPQAIGMDLITRCIMFFTIKASMKIRQRSILISVTTSASDYAPPQVPTFSSA